MFVSAEVESSGASTSRVLVSPKIPSLKPKSRVSSVSLVSRSVSSTPVSSVTVKELIVGAVVSTVNERVTSLPPARALPASSVIVSAPLSVIVCSPSTRPLSSSSTVPASTSFTASIEPPGPLRLMSLSSPSTVSEKASSTTGAVSFVTPSAPSAPVSVPSISAKPSS